MEEERKTKIRGLARIWRQDEGCKLPMNRDRLGGCQDARIRLQNIPLFLARFGTATTTTMKKRHRSCKCPLACVLESAMASPLPICVGGKLEGFTASAASVREIFLEEACAMPWQLSTTRGDSKHVVETHPTLLNGHGSRHTSGKCVEKVLARLDVAAPPDATAQYLLFIEEGDNMNVHVDPSRDPAKNLATILSFDEMSRRVRRAFDTDLVTAQCVTLFKGDVVCFVGNRLHAVYNAQSSFSFGNHYARDATDELVLYGVLSGCKLVALFHFPDRAMDAFIDTLTICVTKEMCMQSTAVAALRIAVFRALEEREATVPIA